MWDWRPGDARRAHQYAMQHATQQEFNEYMLLDCEFDDLPQIDLVDIFKRHERETTASA